MPRPPTTNTSVVCCVLGYRLLAATYRLKLLPNGSDLAGAGSLAAILATPEVLEAAAVMTLLGGVVVWALNFASGAVGSIGSVMDGGSDPSVEEDEFT